MRGQSYTLTRRQALEAAFAAFAAATVASFARRPALAAPPSGPRRYLYVPGYRTELAGDGGKLFVDCRSSRPARG